MKDNNTGYTEDVYKVERVGSHYRLFTTANEDVGTLGIPTATRKRAYEEQQALRRYVTDTGQEQYRRVDMEQYDVRMIPTEMTEQPKEMPADIKEFVHEKSVRLLPQDLVIDPLKWKYLVRSVLRSKNIMMVGPTGSGKTKTARAVAKALDTNLSIFNLGSTQDARATLIGNTHFDNDKGTFFAKSAFVEAIQRENEIILLDELSRAHPEAWNILMPVLDESQRYLRLDEEEGSPTVEVAKGVTFIATANIGNEYTSARVMDRATLDRFVTIEMDLLNAEQEYKLLQLLYPEVSEDELMALSEIAGHTRDQYKVDTSQLTTHVSTRSNIEAAGLINDGFSLLEATMIAIFPFFSEEGGVDSERTYIKQYVQKYIEDETDEQGDGETAFPW